MRATIPIAPSDLESFFAWEEGQAERYELVGGIVRLMAGGTEDHDRISGNIFAALGVRLRGTPCSAHLSNPKVVSRATNASMYPDVFVRCGPRQGGRTETDDPVTVFEVLSESTAEFDLTRKRLAYEAIPTLRRIVYVSVREARLAVRVRGEDDLWRDDTVEGLEAELVLPEIGLALPMAEIYEESDVAAAVASAGA